MMLAQIFSEELKTLYIVAAQLVRVLVRSFELLHHLYPCLLNLRKSFVYLLIFQPRESLLNINALL